MIEVWPTYEIMLPANFDLFNFWDKSTNGENGLWLIRIENELGMQRYKGIVVGKKTRVFIDIYALPDKKEDEPRLVMFVTTPQYQKLSPQVVAETIYVIVGGIEIYHQGERVRI